jgi:agmatine/peptidylarginine deiminase
MNRTRDRLTTPALGISGGCAKRIPWSLPLVAVLAAGAPLVADPILTEGGLIFPEGAAVPRSLTKTERVWLADHPLTVSRGVTSPPAYLADVRCPGEYEPMQGLLFAWEPFGGVGPILSAMIREVTTTGNADAYVMVDSSAEQSSVATTLSNAGANMARVAFSIVTTDTIWIRDYGPRYIYEGNVRSIVDHTYNRPRPNDDIQPEFWSTLKKHTLYGIPLIHGGGNFHLSTLGTAWSTELIDNENAINAAQIIAHWLNYQNLSTTITQAFPTAVDSTQHIDMWMQIIADNAVMISDWPLSAGSTQDTICDNTAASMASLGWNVFRVPALSVAGVHYTFTNVVICNNLVLVPSYSNATVVPYNAPALAAWQAALPGKTILQINCQALVTAAGVMHCIVMHVPAHLGGANPTAYLRTLRGPETLTPGSNVDIRWSADDDQSVSNVDILLSTDGGVTFPTVLAAATADDGLFTWTVPSTYTTQARLRVVARDALGNTGFDSSRDNLFINAPPPPCVGDANNDRIIDFADITAILANFGSTGAPPLPGDSNQSGAVDFGDITATLSQWAAACP